MCIQCTLYHQTCQAWFFNISFPATKTRLILFHELPFILMVRYVQKRKLTLKSLKHVILTYTKVFVQNEDLCESMAII